MFVVVAVRPTLSFGEEGAGSLRWWPLVTTTSAMPTRLIVISPDPISSVERMASLGLGVAEPVTEELLAVSGGLSALHVDLNPPKIRGSGWLPDVVEFRC